MAGSMVDAMHTRDIVRSVLVQARSRPGAPWTWRAFDLAVASAALFFLGPLMLMVATVVALERKGPVLFRHARIGKGGAPFQVFKFRSMAIDGDCILAEHLRREPAAAAEWAQNHKLRVDPRVSVLGRVLRQTSLDELPQLFNVLKGEMSIVGPRPIVAAEIPRYGRMFIFYCAVPPGITGIWQVSGRSNISYRRRVAMDALYSRRKSVLLDLRLICATVPAVLTRRGSY